MPVRPTIDVLTRHAVSIPGAVVGVGLGCLLAAANWFSIARGFDAAGASGSVLAVEAADRAHGYLLLGVVLAVPGALLMWSRMRGSRAAGVSDAR